MLENDKNEEATNNDDTKKNVTLPVTQRVKKIKADKKAENKAMTPEQKARKLIDRGQKILDGSKENKGKKRTHRLIQLGLMKLEELGKTKLDAAAEKMADDWEAKKKIEREALAKVTKEIQAAQAKVAEEILNKSNVKP